MRKWIFPLLLLALLIAPTAQASAPAVAAPDQVGTPARQEVASAATVPPGFSLSTFVDGLTLPTDMVFLPNGDLLVAEKGGYGDEVGTANVRLIHKIGRASCRERVCQYV